MLRILISSLLAWGLATPLQDQVYQVSAEEVVFHVLITDRAGKAVTDIRPRELLVEEDGVEQKVERLFTSEVAFDVGLLLDTSNSTYHNMADIRIQSGQFLYQLPEGHRMMVLTFDDEVYVDCDWTEDRRRADEAVLQVQTNQESEGTILHEAIKLAALQKYSRQRPRQALIVYTDGVDHGSRISREESIRVIEESGILVFTMQYDSRDHYRRLGNPSPDIFDPPPGTTGTKVGPIMIGGPNLSRRDRAEYMAQMHYESAKKYLGKLASAGGGRYFETPTVQQLKRAYGQIIRELSRVFTVTWIPRRPAPDGEFHRVRIRSTRDGVAVRTLRDGYWSR